MAKVYTDSLLEEMKLLAQFPEESHLEGLKIHDTASSIIKTSAQALFDKGMISQTDGGYLTDSGREMAEHLHNVLDALARA
ncbi:MAG: TIGR02647 family protein [Pseudomonadota bacterium]